MVSRFKDQYLKQLCLLLEWRASSSLSTTKQVLYHTKQLCPLLNWQDSNFPSTAGQVLCSCIGEALALYLPLEKYHTITLSLFKDRFLK